MTIKSYKNKKYIYKNIKITADLSLDFKILTLSVALASSGNLFHSWAHL